MGEPTGLAETFRKPSPVTSLLMATPTGPEKGIELRHCHGAVTARAEHVVDGEADKAVL